MSVAEAIQEEVASLPPPPKYNGPFCSCNHSIHGAFPIIVHRPKDQEPIICRVLDITGMSAECCAVVRVMMECRDPVDPRDEQNKEWKAVLIPTDTQLTLHYDDLICRHCHLPLPTRRNK